MKSLRPQLLAACAVLFFDPSSAAAAPITLTQLNGALGGLETKIENIFDVTVGTTTSLLTDISFLPVTTIADPATYLTINTFAEQQDLLQTNALGETVGGNVVTAYVVEEISYCGGSNSSTIGCADIPGNVMYLEGIKLLADLGDELWAHELGHNLNLFHNVSASTNLMHGAIEDGDDELTAAQLMTINMSSLIQGGTVTIKVVLITPSEPAPVPLPTGLVLFAVPGILVGLLRRKRPRYEVARPR